MAPGKWQQQQKKGALVLLKMLMGMRIIITKTDIVPITCRAWDKSCAPVGSGKRAITMRGWGPLNQTLLSAPENLNTKIFVSVEDDDGEQQ